MPIQFDDFEKWNNEQMTRISPEDYYHHANFLIRYIERKRIRKIIRLVSAQSNDRILEVGCGQGHILEKIEKGKLYGIDISDKMLTDAAVRLKNRAKLFKLNAEDFSSHFNFKFNKVICSEVLEHTQNPEKVIEEIYQVLEDDGYLIISIPNEKMINLAKRFLIKVKIFRIFFKNIPEDTTQEFHLHSFDLSLLKKIIKGKFKIQRIIVIPFFFLPFRYVVKLTK